MEIPSLFSSNLRCCESLALAAMAARLFSSSKFRRMAARSSFGWSPPRTVPCIADEIRSQDEGCVFGERACSCDKRHWLAISKTNGLEFTTQHALFHHYISTLASVLGSKREAMKRIYLVSIGWRLGFGAEINAETKYKLEANPDIVTVVEDCRYQDRNKDPQGSLDRFIPFNSDDRFNDIYSYHHFSECKSKEKPNHWLIHVKKPDGGFVSEQHTIEFCTNLLATVLGSEKEAKKRIYIVWCKAPFGFAAEIDEETVRKLRGPQILTVLPDYAFDVKEEDRGVLIISHLSRENSQSAFSLTSPNDPEDYSETDYSETDYSEYEEDVKDANYSEESNLIIPTRKFDNYEIAEDSKYSISNVYSGSAKDTKDTDKGEDFDDINDAGNAEASKIVDGPSSFLISPDPRGAKKPSCGPCYRHWFITMENPFGDFLSTQKMIDHYIETLARVVGSEKEAKEKIYRVACEENLYGFGAEIDEETSNKLKDVSGVRAVIPEFFFSKDHRGGDLISNSQSVESFEALLRSFKLDLKEWKISV